MMFDCDQYISKELKENFDRIAIRGKTVLVAMAGVSLTSWDMAAFT